MSNARPISSAVGARSIPVEFEALPDADLEPRHLADLHGSFILARSPVPEQHLARSGAGDKPFAPRGLCKAAARHVFDVARVLPRLQCLALDSMISAAR